MEAEENVVGGAGFSTHSQHQVLTKAGFTEEQADVLAEINFAVNQALVSINAKIAELRTDQKIEFGRHGAETEKVWAEVEQAKTEIGKIGARVEQVGARVEQIGVKVEQVEAKIEQVRIETGAKVEQDKVGTGAYVEQIKAKIDSSQLDLMIAIKKVRADQARWYVGMLIGMVGILVGIILTLVKLFAG